MDGKLKLPWLGIAYGVICGLLGAGLILLISQPPRGKAIELLPLPTPQPLVIYVSGEVNQPGVYTLPSGSRIIDAIQAAGGVTDQALTSNVNLAERLVDSQQVMIPSRVPTLVPGVDSANRSSSISVLVNINTADQDELESLPEIGPVIAEKIIAYRDKNGPFQTIEAIQNVEGIGPETFAKIELLITVGD